jgi:hypothetical protein
VRASEEADSENGYCQYCGVALAEEQKFCAKCGKNLERENQSAGFCENCGTELFGYPGSKSSGMYFEMINKRGILAFCPKCGVKVEPDNEGFF